ncbi:uncharacterized protein ACIBXB_002503 [Morphnus guianensis]
MGNSPSPCLKVSSAGPAFLHLGIAAGERLAQRALTHPEPLRNPAGLRHYLINKMLSSSVGLHLALKPGFPSIYRTALGFWGKTSPLGNKREDIACVGGPVFLSPVETSDTSIAKEHIGVPAPAELSRIPPPGSKAPRLRPALPSAPPFCLSLDTPGEPLLGSGLPLSNERKPPLRQRQAGSFHSSGPHYAGRGVHGTPGNPTEPTADSEQPLRHDEPPSPCPAPRSLYTPLRADWLRPLSVRLGISRGRNQCPPHPSPVSSRTGGGLGRAGLERPRERSRLGGAVAGGLGAVRGFCRPWGEGPGLGHRGLAVHRGWRLGTGSHRPGEGSRWWEGAGGVRGGVSAVAGRFPGSWSARAVGVKPRRGPGPRCPPGICSGPRAGRDSRAVPQFPLSRGRAGAAGSSRRSRRGRLVAGEPGLTGGGNARGGRGGRLRGVLGWGGSLLPPRAGQPRTAAVPRARSSPPSALHNPGVSPDPHVCLLTIYFWACGSPHPRPGRIPPRGAAGGRGSKEPPVNAGVFFTLRVFPPHPAAGPAVCVRFGCGSRGWNSRSGDGSIPPCLPFSFGKAKAPTEGREGGKKKKDAVSCFWVRTAADGTWWGPAASWRTGCPIPQCPWAQIALCYQGGKCNLSPLACFFHMLE